MVYPVTAVTTMVFMGTVFISELPVTAGTLFTVLGLPVTAGTPLIMLCVCVASMVYPVIAVTTMVIMDTVLGHPVTAGTPLTVVMSYFIWSDAHLGDITPSEICIEFFRGLIPALNL